MAEVLSRNLFDLLDDEAGSRGAAGPQSQSQSARKPERRTVPGAAAKEGANRTAADNSRAKPNEHGIKRDYPRRGGANMVAPVVAGDVPGTRHGEFGRRDNGRGGRPGGRGGMRGGRGGRGREFDRRSGTGRFDGEKKEMAGKGSWGNPTGDETVEQENGAKREAGESVTVVSAAEGEAVQEALAAQDEEVAEVVKTLDQFLAERAKAKAGAGAAQLRRANEGADDSQWKDAVPLARGDGEAFYFAGKGAKQPKKSGKARQEKTFFNIEQRFNEGDGARGGSRGGFRGGARGGRGGSRGGAAGRSGAMSLSDPKAFPELSH